MIVFTRFSRQKRYVHETGLGGNDLIDLVMSLSSKLRMIEYLRRVLKIYALFVRGSSN